MTIEEEQKLTPQELKKLKNKRRKQQKKMEEKKKQENNKIKQNQGFLVLIELFLKLKI